MLNLLGIDRGQESVLFVVRSAGTLTNEKLTSHSISRVLWSLHEHTLGRMTYDWTHVVPVSHSRF